MSECRRTKVLVDTDIGTDPDDGLALAYLALHPACDLLGITIVTGNVQQRAAVAEILLRACGRTDIPIHLGRREPLLKGAGQPLVQQYEYVKDLGHNEARQENTAVEFLRQTIRQNPNEVVLLTIGPMSNIGTLFALDPELPSLCQEIISMCGKYFGPEKHKKEWNMLVDETAAGIVLNTRRPRHRFVGLDVTRPCTLQADQVEKQLFQELGQLGALLRTSGDWWLKKKGRFTFHDPLAAAMIFQPELCHWKKGRVVLEAGNGATSFEEGEGSDFVAAEVDPEAFFLHYFGVVTNNKS
ncbi:putative Inosine/uridine-preferring nucleoside hydrolase [Seiridium cardinale]